MTITQWLADRTWAANMRRVRKIRRVLLFSDRQVFDKELRPFICSNVVAYPDAIYNIRSLDIDRAMDEVERVRNKRRRDMLDRCSGEQP